MKAGLSHFCLDLDELNERFRAFQVEGTDWPGNAALRGVDRFWNSRSAFVLPRCSRTRSGARLERNVLERSVATTIHGRYLAIPPATSEPAPLLVGFHGYAENAEAQLERLRAIPGGERWVRVSIQALHRFYQSRTNTVVASWMTRQDRVAAIADNIGYVSACIDAVAAEWRLTPVIVFAGFSQGAGMAFRAAAHASHDGSGVIAVGGDIPPELEPGALKRLTAALIIRGASDAFYPGEKFGEDERRLRECSVNVCAVEIDGGHEWSSKVTETAARFLAERYPG